MKLTYKIGNQTFDTFGISRGQLDYACDNAYDLGKWQWRLLDQLHETGVAGLVKRMGCTYDASLLYGVIIGVDHVGFYTIHPLTDAVTIVIAGEYVDIILGDRQFWSHRKFLLTEGRDVDIDIYTMDYNNTSAHRRDQTNKYFLNTYIGLSTVLQAIYHTTTYDRVLHAEQDAYKLTSYKVLKQTGHPAVSDISLFIRAHVMRGLSISTTVSPGRDGFNRYEQMSVNEAYDLCRFGEDVDNLVYRFDGMTFSNLESLLNGLRDGKRLRFTK